MSESQTADLVENVAEDPDLESLEKETTIRFAKDEGEFDFFTAEAGLMRRVLQHPAATDYSLVVVQEHSRHPSMKPKGYESGRIVGVNATLPVSTLSIKSSPRKVDAHSRIISAQVIREDNRTPATP